MNKTDRKRLQIIVSAIDNFPFPQDGSGTKTASLKGMAMFQRDARTLLPGVRKVLNDMIFESVDTPENDIEEGWDYQNPEKSLDDLKRWMDERSIKGWG